MQPQLPISVDETTGIWTTDGLPMIYVPRHFFVNNHVEAEAAIGRETYAASLYKAGHRSAYFWCEQESRTHGLQGLAVYEHYLKRLSQRGWAQFRVEAVDPAAGTATVRARHSVFVSEAGPNAGRKTCYMFLGWLVGSLEYVRSRTGQAGRLAAREVECGADGGHDGCVFEVGPAG